MIHKPQFISALYEKTQKHKRLDSLFPSDVGLCVTTLLDGMTDALLSGQHIEVRGFGRFTVRDMPARNARNPKTNEAIVVDSKRKIHFKPGNELKDRVNSSRLTCEIKK